MWIQLCQELPRHPKTKKLSRLLKISKAEAVGHLVFLWCWASDFTPEGNLSKYDKYDISEESDWQGDPEEFINALIESHFLDKTEDGFILHDWEEYTGKFIRERKKEADRKRKIRTSGGHPVDIRGTSGGQELDGGQTATVDKIIIDNNRKDLKDNSTNKENLESEKEEVKNIKEEISNFYTSLTGRLCNGNDSTIITEIFNSINPLNYTCGLNIIKKVMSDVFQYKSKQEPPNNKINGLKFFRDPVLIALKKAKPSAPGNGGREGGRYISNDLTAEIEREMKEFEIRKREIEEAKRKEVIVSG